MRRARPILKDSRGTAAVEFALLAPVLITLVIGGTDVSSAVLASLQVTNAAADVSELVAAQSSVNASSIADFCRAAQLDMTPMPAAPLQVGIASVTQGAGGAAVDWQSGCGGASSVPNPTGLASGLIPRTGDSVIIVRATYQFTLPAPLILPPTITLTQTSMYRPRNNTTVTFS
jgi:Flp pilus assembly protein TadG